MKKKQKKSKKKKKIKKRVKLYKPQRKTGKIKKIVSENFFDFQLTLNSQIKLIFS